MNFRIKVALQTIFSIMPGNTGTNLNYFFQKHVTHAFPQSYEAFLREYDIKVMSHLNKFKELTGRVPVNYYEFGAGWSLLAPLGFYSNGVENLHVIDISKLTKTEIINQTIKHYSRMNDKTYALIDSVKDLLSKYHIFYDAPCNAASTNIRENSIDLIVTNVVLEHIPEKDIPKILQECYRILSEQGLLSFLIDYHDHYTSFDKSISSYNYLKYSKLHWKLYNPAMHYQNRLRHKDYKTMLQNSGFHILYEEKFFPKDVSILEKIKIHSDFSKYSLEELKPTGGWFVVSK